MADLPSGTVTFLFTDIKGSTRLWEQHRSAMADAVDRHLVLLRTAIEPQGGVLFKVVGDATQVAFPSAPGAVAASLEAQRTLRTAAWGPLEPLRVRMALHTGGAEPQDGDYLTPALNRLARLLAVGHGGQVLLSEETWLLVRDALPDGSAFWRPLSAGRSPVDSREASMGASSEMPPEARRAAWDALWRILLAPPSNQDPGAEPADSETHVPPQGRHPDSFLGDSGQ